MICRMWRTEWCGCSWSPKCSNAWRAAMRDDFSDIERVIDQTELAHSASAWGAGLLDAVHGFLGRFVAYPSEEAHVAHALWIAHAHCMDAWESTPRIAFLSP